MSKDTIKEFKGQYYFLSNFYSVEVTYNGITYKNNESAFQAQKDPQKAASFAHLESAQAKRKGRAVRLRHNWDKIKEQIMYEICLAKFTQNENLKLKLLETGDAYLEEGNDWGDKEWGVVNGKGKNKLGKILMRVREELR